MKVWITQKKLKSGKTSYFLRWVCPTDCKWKSRRASVEGKATCTDKRLAEREAAKLETELTEGAYRATRRATWDTFTRDYLNKLAGVNREEAERTLAEFHKHFACDVQSITYAMLRRFVQAMRDKGNAAATINKKARYIRAALNEAVELGYLAASPFPRRWTWEPEDRKEIRVITETEQAALLKATTDLYGDQLRAFILTALVTAGRRNELTGLLWDEIDLSEGWVTFKRTKGRKDRRVPLTGDALEAVRALRLNLSIVRDDGPFTSLYWTVNPQWEKVRDSADVGDVTIHDLRRTAITRWALGGVAMPIVQRLAGHAKIATTVAYYTRIDDNEARAALARATA